MRNLILDLFGNPVGYFPSLAFFRLSACKNALFNRICSKTGGFRTTLLCFFLLIPNSINAFENFTTKLNIGNSGFRINYFQHDNHDGNTEMFIDLLNFGFEHEITRIGLEYSPIKFRVFYHELNIENWSLFNLNLYWNTFDLSFYIFGLKTIFFGGPFSKVNYIFADADKNTVKWNEFIYTLGFRLGLTLNTEYIYLNILGGEVGYRNINGKNAFYMGLNIDFIPFLLFLSSIRISFI